MRAPRIVKVIPSQEAVSLVVGVLRRTQITDYNRAVNRQISSMKV